MTNQSIEYPSVETWFLLYNVERGDPYSYGSVKPSQCMESGLLIIETFLSEAALIIRMDELGYKFNILII